MADTLPGTDTASSSSFEAESAVKNAANVGLKAAGVGLALSTIQNALGRHNHGAMGVFTRTGGTIGFFAAMGATFAFTETFVANQRETKDALNGAVAGCAAGFLAGVKRRSLPLAVGSCVLLGAAVGTMDYNGTLGGDPSSREERRRKFFKAPPKPLLQPETSD